MAISYLPSEGGINKVGLTRDNLWFGDSIGGKIVDKVKVSKYSNTGNYFTYEYANLDSTSRWFYKDVTEYNFLNGVTIYRCLYIGADQRYGESEILGNIAASLTHNGPVAADNSVLVDISFDGKYTVFTSQGSRVLETEQDPTDVLINRNDWASSITYNDVLQPGEFIKVWIRMRFANDATYTKITNYDYFVSIKDLSISMRRTNGRMSMSKIFDMPLKNVDSYILKETLPREAANIKNIYKVIDNGNYLNIFYVDNEDFKLLIVKTADNLVNTKYLEMDISSFVPGLTANNEFLSNFSQCYTTAMTGTSISTSGTSGDSETVGTTGFPIDYPDIPYNYDSVVGTKFLVDVHGTEKIDRNDLYLFFNTFLTETSEEYVERYGHRNYYWNCGLVHINLNHINDIFFDNIEPGYDNREIINLLEQYTTILNDKFFISSITVKNDLFTGVGYIPEDCRITNNKAKLFYLWEGDIVNREPLLQMFNIPAVMSTEVNTMENVAKTDVHLVFDDTHVNLVNFGFFRDIKDMGDDVKYIHMGPAAQSALHHGLSPVTYDMTNTTTDQYSSTWAFGISEQSISIITPPPTSNECIINTANDAAADIPDDDTFDPYNPNHWHVVKQSYFDSLYAGDITVKGSDYKINIIDKYFPIFNIHCLGNTDISAILAEFNFNTKKWNLTINDESGNPFTVVVQDVPLFITAENTVTVNLFRQLDYGCAKKYVVHMEIWVNGKQLFMGISYTRYTNDIFTITHNNAGQFSGWVSYWELKKYIETDVYKYALQMFEIFSNIAWAELEDEIDNITEVEEFKMFNFRRNVLMRNLTWSSKEPIVIPIVLQGNGYNISTEYNLEVRRSVFNFNKIDINQKTFGFSIEGSSTPLEWMSGNYDIERDMLIVWVRVDNWSGQRITMYYSDSRVIVPKQTGKPYHDDWYAAWHMNNNVKIPKSRFVNEKIFSAGENFINIIDSENNNYLISIDKEYVFGYAQTYKSNKFDIQWDDRTQDKDSTDLINDFIRTNVAKFKPGFSEIRNVKSTLPYKTESGGNNFQVRNNPPADSNIVVPAGPSVFCRI